MRLPDRLVLASGNRGKLAEIGAALEPLGVAVEPLASYTQTQASETAQTFIENALLKARHAAAASELPALADDSGLVVDALQGRPGVHSARYAGVGASDAANRELLLREMAGKTHRHARFYCCLVLISEPADPLPLVAQGVWEGLIHHRQAGEMGFGYDAVFWDPALGRTAAQLEPGEKLHHSHRGKALRELLRLAGQSPASSHNLVPK